MIVAVMQPYVFPYVGYFQLAKSVDHFVFFDDVGFIKKGFINKNKILLGGAPYTFTLPVVGISQNKTIGQHYYLNDFSKFLNTINHAYLKAPFFDKIFPLIKSWCHDPELNVAKKNVACIKKVFDYLDIDFSYSYSSAIPRDSTSGQQRILEICEYYDAKQYHNAVGGKSLYAGNVFSHKNFELFFLENHIRSYGQFSDEHFVSSLSIIDVMMFNHPEQIREMFQEYSLERAT